MFPVLVNANVTSVMKMNERERKREKKKRQREKKKEKKRVRECMLTFSKRTETGTVHLDDGDRHRRVDGKQSPHHPFLQCNLKTLFSEQPICPAE